MAKKLRIRPIALCVLRHQDRLLLHEFYDPVAKVHIARSLGGGIDFGETSQAAVIREIKEELGADITDVKLLGILESIFVYEGEPGHEIVFVYDGRFVDESLYQQQQFTVVEGKRQYQVGWHTLEDLRREEIRLVPEAIWDLL